MIPLLTKLTNLLRIDDMDADKATCAFQSDLTEPNGSIVYLPEGRHTINATVGGKPRTVDVSVDRSILASFSDALKERQEANVRPFAGFDHQAGPASFIPLEFRYEDGVGLVLDVEWTNAGRAAIEGKDYSYFSPTFLLSKDGIPYGLTKRGEIGSLVNDPAFESIERIAAQHTEPQDNQQMEHLVELGLVEASCDADQALEIAKASLASLRETAAGAEEAETVKAANEDLMKKLEAAEAQIAELQAACDGYKKQMLESAEASANAAIEDAVKAGRIAPQDDASKAFWKQSILSNPEAAKVLAGLPVNPVVEGKTILAGRKEEVPQDEPKGLDRVLAAFKSQSESQS